jgi:hypothetical protein
VAKRGARVLVTGLALLGAGALCGPGCVGDAGARADQADIEDLDPAGLHWVAPLSADVVVAGEPLELTVFTQSADARVVRFTVDGTEVGACDPAQPDEDCRDGQSWFWTTALETPGRHTLGASFTTAAGTTVRATREVEVVQSAPPLPTEPDEIDEPVTSEEDLLTDDSEDAENSDSSKNHARYETPG